MGRQKNFDQQDMLEKATELFWCKGYFDTSMQDLTEGLGISRSSLYDTFGGKRELFLYALRQYMKGMSTAFKKIIDEPGSAKIALKNLLEISSYNLLNNEMKKGCFWVNSIIEIVPHDKTIAEIIETNDKELREAFYKVIKKGQKRGEISTKFSAGSITIILYNTMLGLRVMAKTNTPRKIFEDIINTTITALL